MALRFGTAGVPHAAPRSSSVSGVQTIRDLGLDAMELAFVRGVRMGARTAEKVRDTAQRLDVVLTVHAPYYINLLSDEPDKRDASIQRILDAARVGAQAGAFSVTFHPGVYGSRSPEQAYQEVASILKDLVARLREEGVRVDIRPETQGKPVQFGSLEEVLRLAAEIPGVKPCVDFAHLHARSGGGWNDPEAFHRVFDRMEAELGREALQDVHLHISGIAYTEKGERHHLDLPDSDFAYREWIQVLVERDIQGVVVVESPNLEGDALLLQRLYREARDRA